MKVNLTFQFFSKTPSELCHIKFLRSEIAEPNTLKSKAPSQGCRQACRMLPCQADGSQFEFSSSISAWTWPAATFQGVTLTVFVAAQHELVWVEPQLILLGPCGTAPALAVPNAATQPRFNLILGPGLGGDAGTIQSTNCGSTPITKFIFPAPINRPETLFTCLGEQTYLIPLSLGSWFIGPRPKLEIPRL